MSETVGVPPQARQRLVARFGPGALDWCDELPVRVAESADRWGLDLLSSGGGGTSRVFRCVRRSDGAAAWLKLTPDTRIAAEEAEALRVWADIPSVVGLLAADPHRGALLLEAVEPGTDVKGTPPRLTEVAALLRDLRAGGRAPDRGSALRPLTDRVDLLFRLAGRRAAAGPGGVLDAPALDRARARARELAGSGPPGLVHGDLHAANVLTGPRHRLVAIDPRPALGDPDFDAVDPALAGVADLRALMRRIEDLAALVPGLSPDRVLGWCRATAALVAAPRIRAGRDDAETRFLVGLTGG
ncbi:phosphotransferase [Streptomyces sp. ISL-10]|uniref:aminoglycoside phosphotransferase family protein n=1 Tax=Streptomyces sp. ISL-10 TaxID=2819172 RepID=UPI001BE93EDD|nr:aminoglycoside phosphotransferase family protein [Streptomyces sp. ISL-10]MBT2365521.1 phosphotransferase [Streptomyces sp. ISL-10]